MTAAAIDDDLAGVGVRRVVEHLGGARAQRQPLAQLQQGAQPGVLLLQLAGLHGALRLAGQLGAGLIGTCLGLGDALADAAGLDLIG